MSAFDLKISAEPRLGTGSSASRKLRNSDNLVPAIVYGGKKAAENIVIPHNILFKISQEESFYSNILSLDVAGKANKVVLKAIQRHPYKKQILHVDFMRVSDNDVISMQVPLHFINQEISPGVKLGGTITHQMISLDIKCKAKDLPKFIEVDLKDIKPDQSIHLSHLNLPKGVSIPSLAQGSDHDLPVASCKAKAGADDSESSEDSK